MVEVTRWGSGCMYIASPLLVPTICTNPLWNNWGCPASALCSFQGAWCCLQSWPCHSVFSFQVIPQTAGSGVSCDASWDKLALPGGRQCWQCAWRSIMWALAPYTAFFCKQNSHFSQGCDGLQKYKLLTEILIKMRRWKIPGIHKTKSQRKNLSYITAISSQGCEFTCWWGSFLLPEPYETSKGLRPSCSEHQLPPLAGALFVTGVILDAGQCEKQREQECQRSQGSENRPEDRGDLALSCLSQLFSRQHPGMF